MANQHIKGLTVEIGGDTTELTAALKDVDKEAKKSSDELKAVNAALKLDPTNTTLVTQKQEILASSIETTKKKLEILKKAEQDAQSQLEKKNIGAEQYRALQREVVYAENKLKKLEKQYDDTKKAAEDAGKAIENAGNDSREATQKNEELSKGLDKLKVKYNDAKSAAKDAGKEFVATAAAGVAAVGATVATAMSYEDALNSIQIQTGASESQMLLYEQAMENVFASGLGEDLDDVASTMAVIAQQTHETDPEKMEQLAKNALILKDSFGFETAKQMRAVQMLVDQFGISSEGAYNLIVQGAQKGLNKNGDLLDVINEYSVHYKNLGYDADEFFNSLYNGAQTGVFSVDKLGDAMKEFGIRVRDESQTTTEAYETLGLDADLMREKFAAGGESAQEAAQIVNGALFSMKDEVAKNTAGVALYGTMWEDMGADAIAAIGDVNGKISGTVSAMEGVRNVKLDSTSTKWAQLGRTMQTELLVPLGEKLLPTAKKVIDYLTKNSQKLIPMVKSIATTAASMWAGAKIGKLIASVTKLVSTYKALKTATTAANAAMSATPWGAVGAAVGLVIGGIGSLIETEKEERRAAEEAAAAAEAERQERLKTLREVAEETRQHYQDMADAAYDSASSQREAGKAIDEEYDGYEYLWEELQNLVDANGNVKKSNEERVELIYGELQEAIGFENKLVDGQIAKYNELSATIANSITMRRAQAYLDKTQTDYEGAKESLPQLQTEYEEANLIEQTYYTKLEELATAATVLEEAALLLEDAKYLNDGSAEAQQYQEDMQSEYDDALAEYGLIEEWLTEHAGAVENTANALIAYDSARSTVAEYEALENAVLSENMAQVETSYSAATDGQMSYYSGASLESLEDQANHFFEEYLKLLEYSQQEGTTITQEQLDDAASTAVSAAYKVLEHLYRTDTVASDMYDSTTAIHYFNPNAQVSRSMTVKYSEDEYVRYVLDSDDSKEERAEDSTSASEPSVVPKARVGGNMVARAPDFMQDPLAVWQKYREITADPALMSFGGVGTTVDDGLAKENNKLLGSILQRLDDLDLTLVLDDDTLIGRTIGKTDNALGRRSIKSRRGSLKE